MNVEEFSNAFSKASLAYVRPYGLYYRGGVYWDENLPRKQGIAVRFFEDPTGPCMSLAVFDLDGNFLCSAYPVAWHEDDHASQHEIRAWLETLSDEERAQLMAS